MRQYAFRTILHTFFSKLMITTTLFQSIQGTITKQAIKIFTIVHLMARKIFTFMISKKRRTIFHFYQTSFFSTKPYFPERCTIFTPLVKKLSHYIIHLLLGKSLRKQILCFKCHFTLLLSSS